jgi:hypothetical protein
VPISDYLDPCVCSHGLLLSFSTATFELAIFVGGTGSFFRNSRKARTFVWRASHIIAPGWNGHTSARQGHPRRRTGKHVIVLGRSPRPRAWYFFYVTAGIFEPGIIFISTPPPVILQILSPVHSPSSYKSRILTTRNGSEAPMSVKFLK